MIEAINRRLEDKEREATRALEDATTLQKALRMSGAEGKVLEQQLNQTFKEKKEHGQEVSKW